MFFFFFKQKTAYEMRISDWSSDVCSSDLQATLVRELSADDLAAGARIHGHVGELEYAFFGEGAAVLQLEPHPRGPAFARKLAREELLTQPQHVCARLLDIDEDRVDALDRGQRIGLRSRHQGAGGISRTPDPAGDRRANRGTAQIDLGGTQRRFLRDRKSTRLNSSH